MKFRAIIVDDDEIFNMLSKKMMQRARFHPEPDAFINGALAIDYLRDSYTDDETYVIFLDINMPIMDGWSFLEEIRTFAKRENTFIFMVTSSTDESDVSRAEQDDFVLEYLTKPVLTEDLNNLKKHSKLKKFF